LRCWGSCVCFVWVIKCFCCCSGVCRGVFCVGMGVGCLHVAAWGVVVVVLVEVEFGVALRFCVARRFINWISALHSLLGGGLERFDRCKTCFTRRFINSDTYITYISMCVEAVRLAAYAGRVCGDAASPLSLPKAARFFTKALRVCGDAASPAGGNMFRAQTRVCCQRLLKQRSVFLPERVSAAVYTPRRLTTQEGGLM
jgi:hypothetical protein